jgi:anti-sigma factor RsiW
MHDVVKNKLEDLLEGPPGRSSLQQVQRHLEACESCRREIEVMQWQAGLLHGLRPSQQSAPQPGFYARVMARVEAQRNQSVLAAFLDPGFARRLVFASLAAAIGFGAYLFYAERQTPYEMFGPVRLIATQASPSGQLGADPQRDREMMLLAVASYQE